MTMKLFVACEIQYFELGILFFNSNFYYLTRSFIDSTSAYNLLNLLLIFQLVHFVSQLVPLILKLVALVFFTHKLWI